MRLLTVLSVKLKRKTLESANKGIKEGQKLYDAKFKYRYVKLVSLVCKFTVTVRGMNESSMANAKPPECNSISTTEVAVTDITKGEFDRT